MAAPSTATATVAASRPRRWLWPRGARCTLGTGFPPGGRGGTRDPALGALRRGGRRREPHAGAARVRGGASPTRRACTRIRSPSGWWARCCTFSAASTSRATRRQASLGEGRPDRHCPVRCGRWRRQVAVYGLGGIGRAVAVRLAALGAEVRAVRRRPELGGPGGVPVVGPAEAAGRALEGAAALVVAAPLTEGTRAAIGARQLARLAHGAVLVQRSRGAIVDEASLLAALDSGKLRGAALDVFEREPLPPEHPFWAHPRVLVQPHVAGGVAALLGPRAGAGAGQLGALPGAAGAAQPGGHGRGVLTMEKIIKAAVDRGASDLHIKAGDVFRARIDGKLVPLTKQPLTPEQTKAIALRLIPNEEDRARHRPDPRLRLLLGRAGHRPLPREHPAAAVVVHDRDARDPVRGADLRVARAARRCSQPIAAAERGMILVTGVTGCGKSSTMAAMIDYINRTAQKHIVTLENPIEFLHRDVQLLDHAAGDRHRHRELPHRPARRAAPGSRRDPDRRDARRRDHRHRDEGGGDRAPADLDAAHARRDRPPSAASWRCSRREEQDVVRAPARPTRCTRWSRSGCCGARTATGGWRRSRSWS